MSRVLAVLGLLLSFVFAPTALAQSQPQVVITAPSNGATVPGPDVTVSVQVTGTTLVPAASATKLEDMHVHYMLDVDPAPNLSGATPIPAGNPNIVHSGALSNTFTAVAPGPHRVAVVLGLSNHIAVQPPVAPAVSFTVGSGVSKPTQLPRTGDASDPSTLLFAGGVVGVVLGIALRGLARRRTQLAP
jgi:LPXTG-motif cell wall-anchored protein